MNIVFVCAGGPNGAARYCRLARAIQQTGRHTAHLAAWDAFFENTSPIQEACGPADLIVLQGENHPALAAAIQRWKARGKAVALDLSPETRLESEPICWSLRLADAITVPSQHMADRLVEAGRAIVVPDYIELDPYLNITPVAHEEIVLGWKLDGSERAAVRASAILPALERVYRARPQVRVAAWDSRCAGPGLAAELGLPAEMMFTQPHLALQEWPRPLATVDIGLSPVLCAQEERRGWTDLLEYMVMRIPWLASRSPAYLELRAYGWLVQNDPGAWERVLLDMIDHLPLYREEVMGEPYLFAISQGIDENIDRIVSTFSEILHQHSPGRG